MAVNTKRRRLGIDDEYTQQLMVDYYRNHRSKSMSRLDALRTAQIYMLRRQRRSSLAIESENGVVSPEYWAAFVLSGDWRGERERSMRVS
jgi:CHAT domain-containing protein